jgi:hypothetical protein
MSDRASAFHCARILIAIVAMFFAATAADAQLEFKRPKTEKPLPNPFIMSAARDEVLTVTKQMLETREIPLDKEDCNALTGECTLISKPVIFIKGIQTKSQLEHYSDVPAADVRNWVQGRYVLRIHISPASPKTSQVAVYTKFEGRTTDGAMGSQWVPLTSKGELEDKVLRCIQDRVLGGDCKDIFR